MVNVRSAKARAVMYEELTALLIELEVLDEIIHALDRCPKTSNITPEVMCIIGDMRTQSYKILKLMRQSGIFSNGDIFLEGLREILRIVCNRCLNFTSDRVCTIPITFSFDGNNYGCNSFLDRIFLNDSEEPIFLYDIVNYIKLLMLSFTPEKLQK